MTGPKLNEKNREAGASSGTVARARYVRMSASKVRVVLDLIRDVDVTRADEILRFTDREAARAVRKVLASAVQNAEHNDKLQADDLFVRACYADEGPTLKRFTPRARGRSGAIMKRTCHISVVLGVMSDERLAVRDAKSMSAASRSRGSDRRARVAGSRAAAKSGKGADAPETQTTAAEVPAATEGNEN